MSFVVAVARAEHRDGILRLVNEVYRKYEPIESALGLQWAGPVQQFWENIIDNCITAQVSHVALSGDRVIGFRLSKILERQAFEEDSRSYVSNTAFKIVLEKMATKTKQYMDIRGAGKILYLISSCVDPKFQGKGVAKSMCKENIDLAKTFGCVLVLVVASNTRSQSIFESMEFTTIGSMLFADMKDEEGKPKFHILDPTQTAVKTYVKYTYLKKKDRHFGRFVDFRRAMNQKN